MKRIVFLLSLSISLSGFVILSSIFTKDKTKYANDFVRIFPPHAGDVSQTINLNKNVSFAGVTGETIFLRDRSVADHLLRIDWDLEGTTGVHVEGIGTSEIFIDSPYFFLQTGNRAKLSRGSMEDWCVDTTFDVPGFTAVQALSANSLVLRTIDLQQRKNLLVKSNQPTVYHDILKKQIDGILCTDGHLKYSREYHRLVYTYSYRNEFLVLDTSLNLILEGKTIDTTSVARISVREIDGKITMSKPPFVVNQSVAVSGKFVFVNSNLVAKNELPEDAKKHSVIDVYSIFDGSYKFSFYINDIAGAKMRSFIVQDSTVFAISGQRISRYNIPSIYLKE